MRRLKIMTMLLCAATFATSAAEGPGYICSMRVDNSTAMQTSSESEKSKKSSGRRTRTRTKVQTKTTNRSLSWPVSISFTGKSLPAAGSVKLKCYFIGTTDGRTTILGDKTIAVTLNENGAFKTVVTSPTEKLVRTKTIKTTRRRRYGGGSSSAQSETKGSRVTGCIIQLMVKDSVEKSFASDPRWSKAAKSSPLPESEIIK